MGTENRPPLACIPSDFNKAVLTYGSTAPADAKQDLIVIMPYLKGEQHSDPNGVSSVVQVSPFACWQSFNPAAKLTSG